MITIQFYHKTFKMSYNYVLRFLKKIIKLSIMQEFLFAWYEADIICFGTLVFIRSLNL